MKIAQLLSTVPDLLPEEYTKELSKLQSSAPPMGWNFVKRRMKNELGKVLDKDLVKDKIQYYFSKKFEVEYIYWGISYKIKLSFSDLTTNSRFLSLSIFDISILEFP